MGIVPAPARKLRTSLGSDRITECDARRVREYLDENFARKVMVAEPASVARVFPNHFIAWFAATFGMPPHRYLTGEERQPGQGVLPSSAEGRIMAKWQHLLPRDPRPEFSTSLAEFSKIRPAANPPQAPQESSGMSCSPRLVRRPAGTIP
ncbi:hypothetical protein [Mesorhizobium sp. LjRoot246]|uniref:hypothetical protein n=1 Tax=Mesorhizobium sp. LjRoot246 TaxID=3342294 RepID=UPI003ECE3267